jgi:hypothetical protein
VRRATGERVDGSTAAVSVDAGGVLMGMEAVPF